MSSDPSTTERLPLDIGVVCAGSLSTAQQDLIVAAARRLEAVLQQRFSDFRWVLHVRNRRDIGEFSREESSQLLRQAADERDTARWDFVVLVTADELIAHYRRFALAALSRPLDAAVVSIARLQGRAPEVTEQSGPNAARSAPGQASKVAEQSGLEAAEPEPDEATTVDRLSTLMLHAIGHLGGLSPASGAASLLYRPGSAVHLDAMTSFAPAQIEELRKNFAAVADTRLEDAIDSSISHLAFQLRASWINRKVIVDAVLAARPWQFPRHLNRLSTTAVSTVALLLMTAESWDLGLSQSPASLTGMALLIWFLTTAFVLTRQQLLLGRHHHPREQIVVTHVSAALIVLAGLAVTWVAIGSLALLAASALFEPALVRSWAASTEAGAHAGGALTYVKMATFCASIGLLISSLGASFEDEHHLQHVVFVDEEL